MSYKTREGEEIIESDIFEAINDWTIGLWETILEIKKRIEEAKVCDTPTGVFPIIENLRKKPSKKEKQRLDDVEKYINNTSLIRKDFRFNKPTLKESNWKQYLLLDENNILEVIEQRWNAYIVYNPITKRYDIYKDKWGDILEAFSLDIIWVERANIDWFFKIIKDLGCYWDWNEWYYYIYKIGEIHKLWSFKTITEDVKKFWKNFYFKWQDSTRSESIVIFNWLLIQEIDNWFDVERITQNWRHLLHITYNTWTPDIFHTLYDVDNMEFIFQKATSLDFETIDDKWTIANKITYTTKKPREKFKFLWDKTEKHELEL